MLTFQPRMLQKEIKVTVKELVLGDPYLQNRSRGVEPLNSLEKGYKTVASQILLFLGQQNIVIA